jgi:hypothetical protein
MMNSPQFTSPIPKALMWEGRCGELPGVELFRIFSSRYFLCAWLEPRGLSVFNFRRDSLVKHKAHIHSRAGIAGNPEEGAYSIVMAGRYGAIETLDTGDALYVLFVIVLPLSSDRSSDDTLEQVRSVHYNDEGCTLTSFVGGKEDENDYSYVSLHSLLGL